LRFRPRRMLVRFSSFLIGSIWDAAAQQHAEPDAQTAALRLLFGRRLA
jgi:hypothetical protein